MEIVKKFWAQALVAWGIVLAWYNGIESQALRVLVLVLACVGALVLIVTALPYLFLLAFLCGLTVVIYLAFKDGDDKMGR